MIQTVKIISAIIFIDLDGFKKVNDTLGHEAGDELLRQISLLFKTVFKTKYIVARLAGGTDNSVTRNESTRMQVVANRIIESLSVPLSISERC